MQSLSQPLWCCVSRCWPVIVMRQSLTFSAPLSSWFHLSVFGRLTSVLTGCWVSGLPTKPSVRFNKSSPLWWQKSLWTTNDLSASDFIYGAVCGSVTEQQVIKHRVMYLSALWRCKWTGLGLSDFIERGSCHWTTGLPSRRRSTDADEITLRKSMAYLRSIGFI